MSKAYYTYNGCRYEVGTGPLDAAPVDEVTMVDPETGGRKGQKLAQFSQIPPDVLWELAEHFAKGAQKYPDDECVCAEIAAKSDRTTPKDYASGATADAGKTRTPTTSPVSATGLASTSTKQSSLGPAVSAGPLNDVGSLTTTMTAAQREAAVQRASEALSATTATSSSERSRSTDPSISTKHLPGCSGGKPNWQRGYDWRLSVDAASRHFALWQQGEDIDPETGSSHLVATIWHLMVLRWFQTHGKGRDYR